MSTLSPKFILLRDISSAQPESNDKSECSRLPAGCLVQEIKGGVDSSTNQLLLQSIDLFPRESSNATGISLFANATLDDLLEVSSFASSLLLAEQHFPMRLIVSRDENWLEEATHFFEDANVLVTVGNAQFSGIIRFADEMTGRLGRWFGVEVMPTTLLNVKDVIEGCDGSPEFQCETGMGLYVTVSSLRLADPILELPFKGRGHGKKRFSARTTQSTAIEKMKEAAAARQKEAASHDKAFWETSEQDTFCESSSVNWMDMSTADVKPHFEVDERIVWFDGKNRPNRGRVVFFGPISGKDLSELIAVEFDEKVGDPSYTGMTNGFGQFIIKMGYGRLLRPNEVIKEVDYGYGHQESSQTSESDKNNVSKKMTKPDKPGITVGKRVVWFKNSDTVVRGIVAYVGKISGRGDSDFYGIRLDERKGSDGFIGKIHDTDKFTCGPGYGIALRDFEIRSALMPESEYDFTLGITPEPDSEGFDVTKIKVKDKIVWFNPKDPSPMPHFGTVLFVGDVKGLKGKTQLGVEFLDPCGLKDWTGTVGKQAYFTCKPGHGRCIPRDEYGAWLTIEAYEKQLDIRSKQLLKISTESTPEMTAKDIPPPPLDKSDGGIATVPSKKGVEPAVELPFTTIQRMNGFSIGDRVQVKLKGVNTWGTIRWMGQIPRFAKINLVGVETDEIAGSPENVVHCGYAGDAKRGYIEVFLCRPGHGKFVTPSDLAAASEVGSDSGWTKVGPKKASPSQPGTADSVPVSRPLLNSPAVQQSAVPYSGGFNSPLRPPPNRPINFSQHSLPLNQVSGPGLMQHPLPQGLLGGPPVITLQMGQLAFTYFGTMMVTGVVMFIGRVHFHYEIHVGLRLDKYLHGAMGGSVDGHDYFPALMGHGVLVPLSTVHPIISNPPLPNAPPPRSNGFLNALKQAVWPSQNQPKQSDVTIRQPSPIEPPEDVLRAVKEADEKERAIADRCTHVMICAMQAENDGLFEVVVDKEDGCKGFVRFLVTPPVDSTPYPITRISMPLMDGRGDEPHSAPEKYVKSIDFFPPFLLHFHLTEGFPEHIPPQYTVECKWVTEEQEKKLRSHLFDLWKKKKSAHRELNVLFESLRHLKSDLPRVMGLEFGILYTTNDMVEFDVENIDTPAGLCVYDTDEEVMAAFALVDTYNTKECASRDEKEKLICSICDNDVQVGQIAPYFSAFCTHKDMVCRECIAGHVKAQVEAGNTDKIKCMGCELVASIHDLADLIDPDEFHEMTRHLDRQRLDRMDDVRTCPSCEHPVIFEDNMIGDNRYINCPHCGEEYCPNCKGKAHGDQSCLTFEQKRQLRTKYNAGTPAQKEELVRQFGQLNIDNAIKDADSEEYIRTHTKLCPSCKSPTEKISGCNHMVCTRCGANFTWDIKPVY